MAGWHLFAVVCGICYQVSLSSFGRGFPHCAIRFWAAARGRCCDTEGDGVAGMEEICSLCEGSGLRIVEEGGRQVARACECRVARRAARMLERARIPKRFQKCSLEAYDTTHLVSDESLKRALSTARSFTKGYPVETEGRGLLFVGSKGLGKTHLAVSILKSLIAERGASGVFWEHKELMENLRGAMFGSTAAGAEDALLRSLTKCDILVLDDLGDLTPSDWTWDTTSYILNSRYNGNLSTIITTNLDNRASLSSTTEPYDRFADVRKAAARLTLGDRIGDRMWSRLQEMCVIVEMRGEDYRQSLKRASFATGNNGAIVTPALQSAAEAVRAALETLQSAADEEVPSFSKAIQDGASVESRAARALIDESVTAIPESAQDNPLVGADRLGSLSTSKLVIADADVHISSTMNDPKINKVYQDGEWVPMLTGSAQEDESIDTTTGPAQERPLVGRDRMGKGKKVSRDVKIW